MNLSYFSRGRRIKLTDVKSVLLTKLELIRTLAQQPYPDAFVGSKFLESKLFTVGGGCEVVSCQMCTFHALSA